MPVSKLRRLLTTSATALLLGLGLVVALQAPASADNPAFGPVRLIPAGTSKCLDVSGISQANGALLQLYDCLPNQWNQQFYFYAVPNCFECYQIVPRHSWKCLDVVGASLATGAAIQQYDCLGFSQLNQVFQKIEYTAGYFALIPAHSYKYMSHGGGYNGSPVYQTTTFTQWIYSSYLY